MSLPLLLDGAFVLIFLIFVGVGVYRGFIKGFVRSTRIILAFASAYLFGAPLGNFFNSAFLGSMVYDGVRGAVNGMIGDAASGMSAEKLLSSFPGFLITDNVKKSVTEAFSKESGERLVSSVSSAISEPIASLISGILGYVTVFIVSLLLLKLVAWLFTEFADQISVLGCYNRLLGGVWGALTGSLFLLTVAAVIKLLFRESEAYTDTVIVRMFCDSVFLDFFKFLTISGI